MIFHFVLREGKSSEPIKVAYYLVSLLWLCFRVISVVLAAADINTHSRLGLKHLYHHDSHCYNVEVNFR